jgi:hypothetical protein
MDTGNEDKPIISLDDMRAGVYTLDKHRIDWAEVNEDLRWWIGGQLDSDGCVRMCPVNGLMVRIAKAESGWHCLLWLQRMLKGIVVNSNAETDTKQPMKEWNVRGMAALDFCHNMKAYCHLKRPQVEKACGFVFGELWMAQMRPVASTHVSTGEVRVFAGIAQASRALMGKPSFSSISQNLRGKAKRAGQFTWQYLDNPVRLEDAMERRKVLENELVALKRVEHHSISEKLSKPFMAGFVDGDGCLRVWGSKAQVHSVSQKYVSICDALQRQYGGTVCFNKEKQLYAWYVNKNAQMFLEDVAPFLIEKRKQAELILGMKAGEAKSVAAALSLLKGNKKRAHEEKTEEI